MRPSSVSAKSRWFAGAALLALALAALLIGQRFAAPELRYRIGYDDDRRTLVRFHDIERNDEGLYAWSKPLAAIFAYGFDGRPALAELRLTAPRPAGVPPALLTVGSSGAPLGSFNVGGGWRRYHLLLPTNPAGDTALTLTTEAYMPNERDPRELGVAFSSAIIRPLGAPPLMPALPRSATLLALPLLGWLIFRRWAMGLPGLIIGLLLVAVVGWAAANPSQGSYLLPTIAWPWLPLLPLALLLATPALGRGLGWLRGWAAQRPFSAWLGLGAAIVALATIRIGLSALFGMLIAAAGALLATLALDASKEIGRQGDEETGRQEGRLTYADSPILPVSLPPALSPPSRSELLLIAAIVGLALAMRLVNLDGQPLGLWRDESRHGLQALRIWQDPSYRPIYVVEGADLPALIFYLMAPVVGGLGPHAWSARLVSALAGGLAPLALWWAARPLIGARGAISAAALIAWASWSLSLSRWAFPATLDHLLLLTAVGLMWRGLRIENEELRAENRQLSQFSILHSSFLLALAGLCAGLSAYAYHTGRLAPLILAVLTAIRLGPRWQVWRRAAPALAAATVVGLLVLSPLLRYIADDWAGYNRRVGAVSVFNSVDLDAHAPLALLLRNIERYTLMWHVQGEPNGRHHAPLAPMLDPASGALLLVGLGLALCQWRNPARLALVIWLPLAIVPGLLSSEAPHAMRSLGGLAPACLLAGLALTSLIGQIRGSDARVQSRQNLLRGLPSVGLLLLSLSFNGWLYFSSMASNPLVYGEFDVAQTMMARAAQAPKASDDPAVQATRVYLTNGTQKEDTVRFLTDGLALNTLDGPIAPLAPGESALIVLPADTPPEAVAAALRDLGPGAREITAGPRYPTGAPVLRALGVGEGAERIMASLR